MPQTIKQLIHQLDAHIVHFEKENATVSSQTIGWHIQHSLLVIQQITKTLSTSNPKEYKWKFNFWRLVILGKNKIPRGKGKAPSRVLPKETITKELLESNSLQAKELINTISTLDKNQFFTHPFFGDLNLNPAKKFIALHTQHHLNIINDIIA